MTERLRIGLLLSSTRENRLCDSVANFVKLEVEKESDVFVFDPLNIDLPQSQQLLNWINNPAVVPENIKEVNEVMKTMDAFIMICAEYHWSIPPGLSNMICNMPITTFMCKPCSFVHYALGSVGGWRVGVQLRSFAGGLGLTCIQKQMGIPFVQRFLERDGSCREVKLEEELSVLLKQLYWMTWAIKNHMAISPLPKWAH